MSSESRLRIFKSGGDLQGSAVQVVKSEAGAIGGDVAGEFAPKRGDMYVE